MPKKLLKYHERQALNKTLPIDQRSVADLAVIIDEHLKKWEASGDTRFVGASAMHRGSWVYISYSPTQIGFHSLNRSEAVSYVEALSKGFVGNHTAAHHFHAP